MFKSLSIRTKSELAMLFTAVIWGVSMVIVKQALADIAPFLFNGLRFLLAFLILAVVSFNDIIKIRRSTLSTGCLLGIFLFIGYVFQTLGLQYTTSSNAGFITGISVVLVPILYALLHRRRPSVTTTITVIFASIGLYLISIPIGSFSLSYGDLLVLIGAFGFALHIIYVDYYSHQHNPLAITGVQILFVGLFCLAIGLVTEPIPDRISFNAAFAITVTAFLATALAFLLQNHLQKFSTPTRFAIVLTTEPIFAALAGYWWAGEHLTHLGIIGAAIILLAMLLSILLKSKS